MLDIKNIIVNKDSVIKNLNQRGTDYSNQIDKLINKYDLYTKELQRVEGVRTQLNEKSKLIGQFKKEKKNTDQLISQIGELKDAIDKSSINQMKEEYYKILYSLPNLLSDDTPFGTSEDDNLEVKVGGSKPSFNFEVTPHHMLDGLDFQKGVKIAQARFVVTTGFIAKLERALMNFMLDEHSKREYLEVTVPFIASSKSLFASGQLPKFENDLFKIAKQNDQDVDFGRKSDFYLLPTAEVALANMHRDEIIDVDQLPILYTSFTQCFRKEAGSAGRDTQGIIRMHQFGKVELFKYTKPESSTHELNKMVEDAENILQKLKLHYRILQLCSQDIGFSMNKTYDLEVWFPTQDKFREVSSCSLATDYQARRSQIRYKDNGIKNYVHTLNGSGMATGRILAAILENYQNEDQTITIPDVLQKYFAK